MTGIRGDQAEHEELNIIKAPVARDKRFIMFTISVFILGDDKESELVCTTLPVVITAGKTLNQKIIN